MEARATLTAVVVTWNHAGVVAPTLRALAASEGIDRSILVVDNHSADGIASVVRDIPGPVHLLQNPRNLGFARAANQGIALSRSRFVALVNPDCVPAPDALRLAVAALEEDPGRAAVAPWLLRSVDRLSAARPHGTVDSSGLAVTRGRRVVDRDSGRAPVDRPAGPVFGASGAFAVFRRSALERVRFGSEYFDETFFAYKEDADLAWRLARAGYTAWFDPRIRGVHARGLAATQGRVPRHEPRALALARLSYRNHLLMLLKNATVSDTLPDLPWIAAEEIGKFAYHLLRRPAVLGGLADLVRLRYRRTARRRSTEAIATVSGRALAQRWFRYRP